MAGLAVTVGIGRFAFTPILPMMQNDLGVTLSQGGWLASANYVGYLLGAVWATAQRARSDYAARAALSVTALSTVAMAYAPSFPSWMLLRTIAGGRERLGAHPHNLVVRGAGHAPSQTGAQWNGVRRRRHRNAGRRLALPRSHACCQYLERRLAHPWHRWSHRNEPGLAGYNGRSKFGLGTWIAR